MATIPIQLSDADLAKIDYLITIGKFKNRSQAIKSMLNANLEQQIHPSEWDTAADQELRQKIIQQILHQNQLKIEIISPKSSVEIVRNHRNR